uniref:Retrotransposon gag domain-containing protein n=1 Tax=Bracon brevicornis TaxID=1563983 RepID=A0A6V7J9B1_9HYME
MAEEAELENEEEMRNPVRLRLMRKAAKLIHYMKINFTSKEQQDFFDILDRLKTLKDCSGLNVDEFLEIVTFASTSAIDILQSFLSTVFEVSDVMDVICRDTIKLPNDPCRHELMMDAIKLFLKMDLTFAGTAREDVDLYLYRVDAVKNCSGLTGKEFYLILPITLKGAAMDWFQKRYHTGFSRSHQQIVTERFDRYKTSDESSIELSRAKLMMKTAMWILDSKLQYSGIRHEIAEDFLTRLKLMKMCSTLRGGEFLKIVPFALKLQAADWYQSNSLHMTTYDDFLMHFCFKYNIERH